jgi:hypothetical protein
MIESLQTGIGTQTTDNERAMHTAGTVKPALSDHVWAKKKWSFNGGGLLIEVEMYGIGTFGTGPSGL